MKEETFRRPQLLLQWRIANYATLRKSEGKEEGFLTQSHKKHQEGILTTDELRWTRMDKARGQRSEIGGRTRIISHRAHGAERRKTFSHEATKNTKKNHGLFRTKITKGAKVLHVFLRNKNSCNGVSPRRGVIQRTEDGGRKTDYYRRIAEAYVEIYSDAL